MAKYVATIELKTIEQQRIKIEATSPIDAQDKIKKLMNSQGIYYSYSGSDKTFKLKRITEIKE